MSDAGLGQAIREAREKQMTLRELARRLGVSAPYLSDVEHGRRSLSAENIALVCKELGISEEWLLGRATVLTKRDIEWINAHPEVLALIRRRKAEQDYPGPRRSHPPRKGRP